MQSQSSESLKVVIRVRPLHQKQQQSIQHYEAYSFGKKRTQKGKLSQAALNFYAKYHHIHPKDAIKVHHNVLSVCDQQYKNTERKMRDFHFQQVFTPEYSNQQIFSQTIKEELGGIFEGVNCTMLAYGITGSGKTFSIFGHPKLERGISYLAFDHLFSMKAQHEKQGVKVTFKFTFIEIYNENVRDLLSEDGKRQVTIGEQKGVVTLSDALEVPINSVEQIATLISYGIAKRTSATTDSNLLSSRSHAILKLSVDCLHNGHSTHSKLFIIDLAGSEKLNMESNQRKNEGSNINRSLLTLGNCINALVQNSKKPNSAHVPYRDSKLTRLLKDSLGGAARTVMIACISSNPFTLDETITTLNYAERAQGIKKDILKNIKLTQSQCPRCRQMGNSISPKKASKKSEDPFEDINIWQSPNPNLQDSEMSSIFIDICQKLYQDIIENSRECQQIQRLRIDLQEPCEQFEQILKDNEQQRVHLKQILFNLLGQKNKIVIKEPQPKINSEKKKIKLNSSLQKSITKYSVQADQEEKENKAPVVKSSQKNKTEERTEIVIPHFQPTAPQHEEVSPFKKDDPARQESNAQSRASFKRRRSKFQVVPRPSSVKKTSEEKALKQRQTFQQ